MNNQNARPASVLRGKITFESAAKSKKLRFNLSEPPDFPHCRSVFLNHTFSLLQSSTYTNNSR